jgi:glycosyltransferase involved in cell wall biosynthesis
VTRRRILRVITRLAASGVATHVTIADRGLAERGWETLLVHGRLEPGEQEIDLPVPGVRTRRLRHLARPVDPLEDARAVVELARVIAEYRPAVIHTHHSKAGLVGRSAAILAGVPRVHTFHGHVFEGYFGRRTSSAIVATERLLARSTSQLIALSERQRADLVARGIAREERIRIVPLGLDLERFAEGDQGSARAALAVDPAAYAIVMLGRLVPIKRVDRLLRIVAAVVRERPETRLYVVGDGSEREALIGLAGTLGIAARVEFRGWSGDPAGWYAAADVVALSSDNEGTPLTLIEAAAAGRPVVATAVGGVLDIVSDGVTGFVVDPSDEEAFGRRLLELAVDPGLRARMARAAVSTAGRFSAARLVDDLEEVYSTPPVRRTVRSGRRG